MNLRVACIQFSPVKAQVEKNLDRIAELARQAKGEGVALAVFPEACVTGYFLEGGVSQVALSSEELADGLATRLGEDAAGIDLVVGYYERGEDGEVYNAASILRSSPSTGKLLVEETHRKLFLPTYGVFDEERFVGRGGRLNPFSLPVGAADEHGERATVPGQILICEDIWHSILPTLAAMNGAHVLLVPAASPARGFSGPSIANHEMYRRILRTISGEHGIFSVNAQLVGFEGGKGLVGGSMIADPFGEIIAEAPVGIETLLVADLDLDLVAIARGHSPMLSDLRTMWPRIQRMVAEAN